ncbi:MAG: indolepyruvate oxidoreductase subunit beta [bacterium]|jgi:indolepyruvate ferredoxin oxidoreductase beta subunit
MRVVNILLVGVGGQGTVLASNVLSKGLSEAGYDVKMSEIHGMSQRGGSVFTQVRFGKEVHSPVIEKGKVDYLIAFEKMEALRYLDMLKPSGKVIVNDEELPSAPIQAGLAEYPEGILDEISSHADTTVIPATEIARELGNERVMNIVLFGALAKLLKLDDIDWKDVIARTVKAKFVDINLKAFDRGQELVV